MGKLMSLSNSLTEGRSDKQIMMIRQTVTALLNSGTKKEASQIIGISENALYARIRNYPEIEKALEYFVESVKNDARRKLGAESYNSANKIVELRDSARSESVQLQASTEILDRAGIVKPETSNNIQVNILNDLKEKAEEYN